MKTALLESKSDREKRIAELYSKGPVRRGLVYCSPWCGHGCKITEFDEAGIKAKALADHLGEGWRPRVWENLGWHYAAITQSGFHMSERFYSDGPYYSLTTGTRFSGSGDTPDKAIRSVLEAIKIERDKLGRLYRDGLKAKKMLKGEADKNYVDR